MIGDDPVGERYDVIRYITPYSDRRAPERTMKGYIHYIYKKLLAQSLWD